MDELVHLGPSPAPSVLLAKLQDGIYSCQGCNVALCKEAQAPRIPAYCPRCSAVLWYYYMGSTETISIDDVRARDLSDDRSMWNDLDVCAFFIMQFEQAAETQIEASEAIYPAFGHYFNSKLFRYLEQLLHAMFQDDVPRLARYIEEFMRNLKSKPGFHWSWIGNFKVAEQYLDALRQNGA